MTFSELVDKLFPFYEYDTIEKYRYTQADFLRNILSMTVKDEAKESWDILQIPTTEKDKKKKQEYLNKIYNGTKPLPQKDARYIKRYTNKQSLFDFFNNKEPEIILNLGEEFTTEFGTTTGEDIVARIVELFYQIIDEILNPTTTTKSTIKPKYVETTTANECLAIIINALSKITEEKLNAVAKLKLDPQPIEDKIAEHNLALRKELINNFYEYYGFINELITEASKTNSAFGRKLTETVQNSSDDYIRQGYSQEEVVSNIASWIKSMTRLLKIDDLYFRILVSYFVQNCEVFYNESSK